MTLDLQHLRKLAEEYRALLEHGSGAVFTDEQRDACLRMAQALSPTLVLALLDRLQQAEDRLANARAHWRITAGSTYEMSGMGRILGEDPTVYPTVMTQVGRKT